MTATTRLLIYVGLISSLTLPAMAEEASPPNAVDDHIETEQKTTHIYVLDNDTADGDPLDPATLSIVSPPSRGDAVVIAKGAVRVKYTATATEPFTDKFRYAICNTVGLCATATVTVNYHATTTTTSSTTTTSTTSTTTPDPAPQPTTPPTTGPSEQTEGQPDQPDDTAAPEPTSTTEPVKPPPDPDNLLDLIDETPSRPNGMTNPPGTTIGESNGFQFHSDMLYLGRTGKDTLRMVATPALMVSGLVGFLMVGLPQNAFGAALGFLAAFRRKRKPEQDTEEPSDPHDIP